MNEYRPAKKRITVSVGEAASIDTNRGLTILN
jgi:hypothetical protein